MAKQAAARSKIKPLLTIGYEQATVGAVIAELERAKCDIVLQLPMRGQVESLNAAVAGSVALYLAYMARN